MNGVHVLNGVGGVGGVRGTGGVMVYDDGLCECYEWCRRRE